MEMIAVRMAEELQRRRYRVTFAAGKYSMAEKTLSNIGLPFILRSGNGYFDCKSIFQFHDWLKKEKVDLIHAHYSKDLWFLVPALSFSLSQIPLILTKHIGTMKHKTDFLHRRLYRRVDAVIGISELITNNVKKTHPIDAEKVVCIPNGVDSRIFNAKKGDRLRIRKNLGIAESDIVIGIAGRLCWWKGYREFLDMAYALLRNQSDVWFLAVGGSTKGEEAEAEAIHDYARSLGCGSRVLFTGFQEKVASYLSAMDLFVYPAYAESFGLVLVEAMAMGLPVISTNCDGIPEIVVHEVTGLLVPARDSQAILKAVRHLIGRPDLMRLYGREGNKRVKEHFDFENMVSQTEMLYSDLIARRKKR
jgi:glycosyltransferase involved in cell wall biosynthesis